MADAAAAQHFEPLESSSLVPRPVFPQAMRSVFGTEVSSPPAGARSGEFQDSGSLGSLESFSAATGIPEVALLFAKAIGAENADDLFHIPRDVWDQLVRSTMITRVVTDETGDEVNQERNLTGVEMGKLNKGRDALHVAAKVELEENSR